MSNFSFFRSLALVKGRGVVSDLKKLAIQVDVQGATDAQMLTFDKQLADISQKTAAAKVDYTREQAEAEAARDNYNRHVTALNDLQSQCDAETDADKKAALQNSIESLLTETQRLQGVAKQEMKEAEDAAEILKEYEEARDILADKLRTARQSIKAETARMTKNKLAEQRSVDRLNAEKVRSGVVSDDGGMDTVLSTMRSMADASEQRTAANLMHAEALKPKEAPKDDNIEAALARASGQAAEPTDTKSRIAGLAKL